MLLFQQYGQTMHKSHHQGKKKISPGSHFHKNILVEYSTETTAIDSNIWVSWISARSVVQKLYPPEFICQCVLSFDLWVSCCFVAAQLLFQNNGITLWKEDKQQENNRNNFSIFLFPRSEIKAKTFQQKLVLTGYKRILIDLRMLWKSCQISALNSYWWWYL